MGDITAFHIKPENRYSTFQCASQFNTLEFASATGKPENGVTIYAMDKTQGPACATCCLPGTIVRNYYAHYNSKSCSYEPQVQSNQINCLDTIEQLLENNKNNYFAVQNGYTDSSNEQ